MGGLEPVGRGLLVVGLAIAAIGLFLTLGPRVPFIGRLPGDIRIERDGVTILIPLASMVLISLLLTIVLNVIGRGR
jgi:hypothetical protein